MAKLYGRRKGKRLRAHHSALVADLLPTLAIDLAAGPVDSVALFGARRPLHLEIGFGDGARLVREAAAHPEIGFIGCEPFVNGLAKALAGVESLGLTNVRLHGGDARDLLAATPDAVLDQVDILYPDPWPKWRQRKRRLITDAFLAALGRAMRPGAALRFATDDADYAAWTLARIGRAADFDWPASNAADWVTPWAGWASTRYEDKARAAGRPSSYLTFVRR